MKINCCASKMAQMTKALDDNPKNLSSNPSTHVRGEN